MCVCEVKESEKRGERYLTYSVWGDAPEAGQKGEGKKDIEI